MAKINLLPWRERLREERRREFLSILGGVVVIAAGIVFLVDRYFDSNINTQIARNEFVRTEIRILDEQVEEINQLRQQKEDIRARINIIADLQGTRPVIVRIFDELVKTLPEGVYYESLERAEDNISIEGVAETYPRITELMRRLDESEWFQNVDLDNIAAIATDSAVSESFRFTLSMALELPAADEEV